LGRELVRGNHVMRYASEDDFGLPEPAFLICRFWLIDAGGGSGVARRRAICSSMRSGTATATTFCRSTSTRKPGNSGAIFLKPIPWQGLF
jgi:hypothetical protein